MKVKNIIYILLIALISINAVNAIEINENTTMTDFSGDDVLSLDMSTENSTDILSAGEYKNVYFNTENYKSSSIINENSNTIFHFNAGTYKLNINSLSGKNFTFIGDESGVIFDNLHDGNRPTLYVSNSILYFDNIQFKYFRFDLINSKLTLNNIEASYININGDGGFIYGNDRYNTINISESTFNNNVVLGNNAGGTIFLKNGTLNCYNSNFTNNKGYQAGAIYLDTATCKIEKCTFKNDNASSKEAGAVFIKNSDCNIIGTIFDSCSASYGAAVTSLNSNTHINGSTFRNNKATRTNDGIIYAMYRTIILNNCKFIGDKQIYLDNINHYIDNYDNIELYIESSTVDLINNNKFTPIYSNNIGNANSIPVKYDLRSDGFVSPVKDQDIGGNCWAFASLSALESCILKATGVEYDFSEENLKNLAAAYSKYGILQDANNGGNVNMSMGYLASWLGAVNEEDDKYCPTSCISPKLDNIINIQNIYIIPKNSNINEIKKAILNYGAVVSSYYHDSAYLKNDLNYYNNNIHGTNHEITIVGWDNNYSKDNFKTPAPSNGAWIVKNSWGTGHGDNGYYYISYYDVSLAKISESYTFILNDSTSFNKNYQYDIQRTESFSQGYNYFKNTFTSTGNEKLVSISSYFDKNINYNIYINVNGKQVHTQTFRTSIDGYFTVQLTKNININKGNKFEVVIYNPKGHISICNESYLTKQLPGSVSWISKNGKTWTNTVSNTQKDFVCCIKAFTITSTSLNERWELVSSGLTKYYGDDSRLYATLNVMDGSTISNRIISFNINGVEYNKTTDNQGIVSIAINLVSGNYTTTVSYKNPYNQKSITVKVTVKSTIVASDVVKYYRNGTQYYATFYDTQGNLLRNTDVTFNINGVFYTRTTNENGVARLNINLNPNEYIITAKNPVNNEEKGNLITVKTILETNDLNKTYGSSERFEARLLHDDTGKPYEGETIQFNVNGVLYYRTTDSNGIARLNINLKPGEYVITSYYNGYSIGNKIIVK